jgi:hypothetical protein
MGGRYLIPPIVLGPVVVPMPVVVWFGVLEVLNPNPPARFSAVKVEVVVGEAIFPIVVVFVPS